MNSGYLKDPRTPLNNVGEHLGIVVLQPQVDSEASTKRRREQSRPGCCPHQGKWVQFNLHRWAYDYSNPVHDADFVPQTTPALSGEEVH